MSELDMYVEVGNMLREIRISSGKTLDDVSVVIDVAPKTLQRYETGERKIRVDTLKRLLDYYNYSYEYFMQRAKLKYLGEATDFSKKETEKLLSYYNKLNDYGKKEAEKRVFELTQIPLYSSEPLVNAAHEIPGSSDEDKAHDEEIMNADDWDD